LLRFARNDNVSEKIGIPSNLKGYGIEKKDIPALVRGSHGSSMRGNPVDLSDDQIGKLIERLI